jgi:four helix bundle protein
MAFSSFLTRGAQWLLFTDLKKLRFGRKPENLPVKFTRLQDKEHLRDFGLKDQIRDASVSIMSNIAEGYERSGTAEFKQFLSIAKGWAGEARSEL